MNEVQVVALLPNGLTKVDLGNDERKPGLFDKGILDDLARRCGCTCERCRAESVHQLTGNAG